MNFLWPLMFSWPPIFFILFENVHIILKYSCHWIFFMAPRFFMNSEILHFIRVYIRVWTIHEFGVFAWYKKIFGIPEIFMTLEICQVMVEFSWQSKLYITFQIFQYQLKFFMTSEVFCEHRDLSWHKNCEIFPPRFFMRFENDRDFQDFQWKLRPLEFSCHVGFFKTSEVLHDLQDFSCYLRIFISYESFHVSWYENFHKIR